MFTISATELARRLGDVLARVRYRHESFVVECNRWPVARLEPIHEPGLATVREVLEAWCRAGTRDSRLADDLARVNRADRQPRNPWASSSARGR